MIKLNRLFVVFIIFFPAIALGMVSGLKLQGQGETRYLGLIKVYDAALYTQQRLAPEKVLAAETSKCLKLDYAVSLSAEDFARGADAILSRQHTPERVAKVKVEIDKFHKAYRNVAKGDSYSLCYDAQTRNTTLWFNQKELVTITSADFAEIYFGIWLGPKEPIDASLRDKLLGSAASNR